MFNLTDQSTYAIILLFASIATVYAIRAQHAHYLPDVYALALALVAPRQGYALAAVVLFVILRHTPLATGLSGGLPEWALWLLLPGAMSSWGNEDDEASDDPPNVPVPGTGSNAESMSDRDITRSGWIKVMALARDENGAYVFSANDILRANHGRRSEVLTQIRAHRSATPPPQYLQPDATTAPATYPVTKRG